MVFEYEIKIEREMVGKIRERFERIGNCRSSKMAEITALCQKMIILKLILCIGYLKF